MKSRDSGYVVKKVRNRCFVSLGLLIVLAAPTTGSSKFDQQPEREKLVRQLVAAFNDRNISGMLDVLDEDAQWLSIAGEKITLESSGKKSLRDRMVSYFRTCKSCKSSLDWIQTTGNRVLAMERATWLSKTGLKSHASLSVYEFRNNKILRVYYFPTEDHNAVEISRNLEVRFPKVSNCCLACEIRASHM